jgi:hypothetical protein
VKTVKPAASLSLTAASNRVTVYFTEYLLGFVIRPLSAACAVATLTHIASESNKLARPRFLKLIVFPTCCWFCQIGRNGPHRVEAA